MSRLWNRYCTHLIRYEDLRISLDVSRMDFAGGFLSSMQAKVDKALADMQALEAGGIANPDENRMVGHYWLRNPELAPAELRDGIRADIAAAKDFAAEVHGGSVGPQRGGKFTRILIIGIGGSALGPQLVSDALVDAWKAPMRAYFLDNIDPDGIQRVLSEIGENLAYTLTLVISKSGRTPESRYGVMEVKAAYEKPRLGLDFSKHAVAVTGTKRNGIASELEEVATKEKWLRIFPMTDWVGGRTSVMSPVGLVPAALQGVDIDQFLAGAAAMDEKTRSLPAPQNISMMLALMWYHAGGGKGAKDMVILPYRDRLVLLSKYFQQLIMESLGKKSVDDDGNEVLQGIAVYGNKGTTDEHSYMQQLLDGLNNFFVTIVEVRNTRKTTSSTEAENDDPASQAEDEKDDSTSPVKDENGVTCADILQSRLRGTRRALFEKGRENMTLSLPRLDAFNLGAIIAVFERAVGFYASFVNINAYHQPGVEAGKIATGAFLKVLATVKSGLNETPRTPDEIVATLPVDPEDPIDPEDLLHALKHLAANDRSVKSSVSSSPAEDRFFVRDLPVA